MLRPLFAKSLWTSKVVPSGFCSKRSCQVFLRYGGMQRIDGCLQLYEVWGHRLNGIETHLACFNGATDDSCWGLTLRKQRNFRQLSCVCIRYKQIFLKAKKYRTKNKIICSFAPPNFWFQSLRIFEKTPVRRQWPRSNANRAIVSCLCSWLSITLMAIFASMYGYLTMSISWSIINPCSKPWFK